MGKVFNSYSLTDDEFFRVLENKEIKMLLDIETSKVRNLKQECRQYIINSLYKTLTRNQ